MAIVINLSISKYALTIPPLITFRGRKDGFVVSNFGFSKEDLQYANGSFRYMNINIKLINPIFPRNQGFVLSFLY
jgi:hypothetical protein